MPIPRQAARALLLDPDDRVLLLQVVNAGTGAAWWVTPGGGLEAGETPAEGLARELAEETGLRDVPVGPALWVNHRFFRQDGLVYSQDETFYLVRAPAFEVDFGGHDRFERQTHAGYRWWRLDELQMTPEKVYPRGLSRLLAELIAGGPPPAPIPITG